MISLHQTTHQATLGYIIYPGPYLMGAFIFIAQPLFVVAAAGYVVKVLRELSGTEFFRR
jgi:hypothetical protein